MCDCSEKLIAWLDRELPENEAAEMALHVQDCTECRVRLEAFKEVDRAFEAYCDESMTPSMDHSLPRWVPVLSGVAAVVVLLLFVPRGDHVERHSLDVPVTRAAVVLQSPPLAPVGKKIHRSHPVAVPQVRAANWAPAEPTIQIAIPAEAMFAPGAIPEGVSLTAEFSIAADGSAQDLRLRP
jgi:anti-sigma factor RsiW